MRSSLSERVCRCVAGLAMLLGTPLHAAPGDPVGGQFQLNSITMLAQTQPSVAPDGAGGFVVVWQSFASGGTDTDASSIQARRFDSSGTPLAPEFQVNTYTTSAQREPEVASFGAGGFVVIWQSSGSSGTDTSLTSIQGRLFDDVGAPVGGEFQVNTFTTGLQYSPAVASDGAGGFLVVWNSDGGPGTDTDGVSVQARRFDATGTPGAQFQVNTYTTGDQHYPAVTPDGAGGYVVVWTSDGGTGTDTDLNSVHGQRFDAGGTPADGEFQVNTYTTSEQLYPVATATGAGFVVLWMSQGGSGTDTSGFSVQGQLYDAAGLPTGGQFQVNTYTTTTQDHPRVGPDGEGGFIAMWESAGSAGTDASGYSAQAQRFDAAGAPVGGEFQVNTYTTLDQKPYGSGPDGSGGFVIVWDSIGSATDNQGGSIQAQRYAGPDPTTTTSTSSTSITSTSTTTLPGIPATSTTTSSSSTTTITAPFGAQALTGQALLLRAKPGSPEKSRLALQSKDPGVTLGRGNASPDDPVVGGATLALSSGAGGFAARHDLAGGWSYLRRAGQNKGYRWKSGTSPVRAIIIKRGKLVKIAGRGAALGADLDADPNPVRVGLQIGGHLYCFEFGGEKVAFEANRRFAAKRAAAPAACP